MITKFLGKECGVSMAELQLFEQLKFERLIEFGTWKGNTSLYLYLLCKEKGIEFVTYDIADYEKTNVKKLVNFDSCFRKKDVFHNLEEIENLIKKEGKCLVFCDGGHKQKEFEIFSKVLKKDDLIIVHDNGREFLEPKHDLKKIIEIDSIILFKK